MPKLILESKKTFDSAKDIPCRHVFTDNMGDVYIRTFEGAVILYGAESTEANQYQIGIEFFTEYAPYTDLGPLVIDLG